MLKVLKITSIMQYLCNITEKWATKLKFYMLINIGFLQVDTFVFDCLVRHAQSTQTSLHYLNIQERNIRDFYKFILSFLTGVARHVQSTLKEQVCRNGMLDYLDFGLCIDLLFMRLISVMCQSNTIKLSIIDHLISITCTHLLEPCQ